MGAAPPNAIMKRSLMDLPHSLACARAAAAMFSSMTSNIAAAAIGDLRDVKLSANWMCAAGHGAEDDARFDTVRAVGMEFCPELGITIPVGKDSMSMRTTWRDDQQEKAVTAPNRHPAPGDVFFHAVRGEHGIQHVFRSRQESAQRHGDFSCCIRFQLCIAGR